MSDKCRKLRRLFVLPDVSFACLFCAVVQFMLSAFQETSFKKKESPAQTNHVETKCPPTVSPKQCETCQINVVHGILQVQGVGCGGSKNPFQQQKFL